MALEDIMEKNTAAILENTKVALENQALLQRIVNAGSTTVAAAEKPARGAKADKAPAEEKKPEVVGPTMDDVIAMKEKMTAAGIEVGEIKKLVKDNGSDLLKNLKPEKFASFIAGAEALILAKETPADDEV